MTIELKSSRATTLHFARYAALMGGIVIANQLAAGREYMNAVLVVLMFSSIAAVSRTAIQMGIHPDRFGKT